MWCAGAPSSLGLRNHQISFKEEAKVNTIKWVHITSCRNKLSINANTKEEGNADHRVNPSQIRSLFTDSQTPTYQMRVRVPFPFSQA